MAHCQNTQSHFRIHLNQYLNYTPYFQFSFSSSSNDLRKLFVCHFTDGMFVADRPSLMNLLTLRVILTETGFHRLFPHGSIKPTAPKEHTFTPCFFPPSLTMNLSST